MTGRRALKFGSEDEVIAYVQHIRAVPLARLGNWSLPQISRHLAMTIEGSLTPPPTDVPTQEQIEVKNKFFSKVLAPEGVPLNMPLPAHLAPPPECDDTDIDRLVTALEKFKAYPHKFILVGKCGPVSVDEVRKLHCVHAAHHLSFLVPASRRTELKYANVIDAIADVESLQKGSARVGNWTLEQACWHLNFVMNYSMSPGPHPIPETPPNARDNLKRILQDGKIPNGIKSPDPAAPPAACEPGSVSAFIQTLDRFRTFDGPFAPHRLFGALTPDEGQRLSMIHCAHHLSYLVPISELTPTA